VVTHTARYARRGLISLSHAAFAVHISLYQILVSTDFIGILVEVSKGRVKEHEGTKASKDSAAASEAASYPLAVSNGLAALALPPAVSPSPPGFHRCLQGSRISSLSPISHFEAQYYPF